MKTKLFAGVILFVFVFSGCGYTTRSQMAPGIQTLYIEPFKNKIDITDETSEYSRLRTYFPLLESDITKAIVDRFVFDGHLKVVKKEDADVILKGELIDYRRDTLRYTEGDNVEEYRISITVKAGLFSTEKNEYLWQQDSLIGDTTYFITGGLAKTESAAVKDAVVDVARRIVERTIEDW